MPGLNPQIPLIIILILTPHWLALYKASMTSGSIRAFSLTQISAGLPFFAKDISFFIIFIKLLFNSSGAIIILSKSVGFIYPDK